MSLWRKLQSKSSGIKAQYAFGIAGVITGFIAIIWISTVPARFAEIAPLEDMIAQEDTPDFQEIFNDSKSQLGNVIDSLEALPNQLEEASMPTGNLDALDLGTNVDPETLDSIDIASFKKEHATLPQASTTQVVEPVEPKVILIGEIKNTATGVPRMILIGTTTKNQ